MKGARTHWHIVGLQYHAAVISPVALQGQNKVLECPGTVSLSQARDPCAKGRGSIASIGCIATKPVRGGRQRDQFALECGALTIRRPILVRFER